MAFVILGLGNPGVEYERTRHNAGRLVVERIREAHRFPEFSLKKTAQAYVSEGEIDGEKVVLVIPDVYMNHSGKVAPKFVKSVPAAKKLVVIRDELDLPLGTIKMTVPGRGMGGHKGAESIARALKTKEFVQVKIGISGAGAKGKVKKPKGEDGVVKHVIGKWKPSEEAALEAVLERAASAVAVFVTDGLPKALQEANTK